MLVLSIWLFLTGYVIAIAGKRNLGVSYAPQPDGSIRPVDQAGNPTKLYSLMDVVTCAPGPTTAGTTAAGPTGSSSGPSASGLPPAVTGDCKPHPGDHRLPGGFIWRPNGGGFVGQLNGSLIGPCP